MVNHPLSIGQCATLACLWEVSAAKPGNVHRGADFDDVTFTDFVTSAVAVGPAMEAAAATGRVGQTVLDAVVATRQWVRTNTNLGTVLLLSPLAAVPRAESLSAGLPNVLQRCDVDDARLVYQAIVAARPGGMGKVESMDLSSEPPPDLITAMRAATERDLVARQYATDFGDLFQLVVPWLRGGQMAGCSLTDAIIHAHIRLMSRHPDSLIRRKCGEEIAQQSQQRAIAVLDAGAPGDENYLRALADLDFWLRSDGHRRNPGTTADMIAAGLFCLLRDGEFEFP